jgi:hypothetical protein
MVGLFPQCSHHHAVYGCCDGCCDGCDGCCDGCDGCCDGCDGYDLRTQDHDDWHGYSFYDNYSGVSYDEAFCSPFYFMAGS